MGINATFGIVGVFAVGTPARLVEEHIEGEYLHCLINHIEILIEWLCIEQAAKNEVVLDTFCINMQIYFFNLFEGLQSKIYQIVRRLAEIKRHYKRSVKSVRTVKLKLSGIEVPGDGFLIALHIKNVQL